MCVCTNNTQVEVEHVKEAFRLLSKSIIRVEQPDIQFEEEEAAGHDGEGTPLSAPFHPLTTPSLTHCSHGDGDISKE